MIYFKGGDALEYFFGCVSIIRGVYICFYIVSLLCSFGGVFLEFLGSFGFVYLLLLFIICIVGEVCWIRKLKE